MTANLTAADAAVRARSVERRHAVVRAWLADNELEALVAYGSGLHAFTGTNPAWYLSAFKQIGPHAAVILPAVGAPLLILTPVWDAARYQERATMEFLAVAPEQFLATVSAEIKRRGFNGKALAVAGGQLQPRAIADAWPGVLGAVPQSAEKLVSDTAKIRDEWSLNCTRRGVDIAERGYQNLLDTTKPGMREFEIAANLEVFMRELGAEDNFQLMSASQHNQAGHFPTDRVLQQGDLILAEITPAVEGEFIQICRSAVIGGPTALQLTKFDLLRTALEPACVRPGRAYRHRARRRHQRADRGRGLRALLQAALHAHARPQHGSRLDGAGDRARLRALYAREHGVRDAPESVHPRDGVLDVWRARDHHGDGGRAADEPHGHARHDRRLREMRMISMEPVLKRGYASWDRDVLPEDEYALRADAVRRALREDALQALIVLNYSLLGVMVDYADTAYLSGLQSGGALLVTHASEPVYVSFGGGRELAFMRSLTPLAIVPGAGKAFDVLREHLQQRGVASGAIGIVGAGELPVNVAARVTQALADYTLRAFDTRLRAVRAVKRPRELLAMRITLAAVEAAVAAGVAAFAAGGDNRAALLEAERVARARKARDIRVLVNMGGPELRPWEGRLDGRHGPLRLWVAAQYQGYWAEAAATSPAQQSSAASRAVRAMQAVVRPGATAGEVAAAAIAALPPAAVDAALAYGLGGSIGLSLNDGVTIRPAGADRLIEGSVLTLRTHVGTGAEPAIATAMVTVGRHGATLLAPLAISG
jgi:Xaa-Pro aminopeptidase